MSILFALVLLCNLFTLAACGGDDENKDCTHEWGEWSVSTPSTCSSQGTKTRKCLNCEETQTDIVAISEHQYDMDNIIWAWNEFESANATLVCKNDSTHTKQVAATITSEITTSGDCSTDAVKTYTATISVDGATYSTQKNQTIASDGHNYDVDNIAWVWVDYETVTATVTCLKNTEHQRQITANVTEEITTPATCTTVGTSTYTATITLNGTTYTTAKTRRIAATGHNYDVDNIAWSWSDYDSAIATVSCIDNESHTRNITASITEKITKDANCGEAGEKIYTASIKIDGETYTNEKKEILPALEHDFDISTLAWQWNGFSEASVILICQNDHNHQQSFKATITSEIEDEPSCTVGGLKRYTATIEIDNTQYSDEKTETLSANGHTYNADNIVWTWTGYETATAIATCIEDCGHSENLTAVITSEVTTPVLCTVNGEKTYTAAIELDGNTYTNKAIEELVAPGHDWNEGETTKEPSEEEDGIITYSCSGCTETYTEIIRSAGKNNWNTAFENAASMTNVTVIASLSMKYGDESIIGEAKWLLDGYKMYIYSKQIDANNAENYYEYSEYYAQVNGVDYCYYYDDGEWFMEVDEWGVDYSVEFLCSTEFLTQLKNSFDKFHYDKVTHTYSAPDFEIVLSDTYSNISLVIVDGIVTQFSYTMTEDDMIETVTMTFQAHNTTTVTLPHIHDWDDGTITTEPTETESGIKTYSCSGCSETKTEIVYAQSQSSWDSAFEKVETTTNVTVNINAVIEDGDETIEAYAFYQLDNYKFYMFGRTLASGGGYYVDECYYTKIDGINYEFEVKYSNGVWVWVKTEYSYDDIPYVLGGLVLPSTLWTELKNSCAEFEYDINTNTYSSATKTMELYGMTISNISIVIENGTLVGFNYTMTYEDGRVQKQEATYTHYGTTIVEIPHIHEWSEWTITESATCTVMGSQTRECACGEKETQTIPYAHTYGEDGICTGCGDKISVGLEYELNDSGDGYIVTGIGTCADTTIIIPSVYNELPVLEIGGSAFEGYQNIVSVVLPDTIEYIGFYAFWGTNISTIHIPAAVYRICPGAFAECPNLISITVDEDNTTYTSIDGNLYGIYYDGTMKMVAYASGKTEKTFTIPNNVTSIFMYAFRCNYLEELYIGADVKEIDSWAITWCNNLKLVAISASVELIEDDFLYACYQISSITVSDTNEFYKIVDGVLFTRDEKTLVRYPSAATASEYVIPSGTERIQGGAFAGCSSLTKVELPDSLQYIGMDAFSYNLYEQVGNSYYVGNWLVDSVYNAEVVTVREGTVGIASGAVNYNGVIVSITIPESVRYINECAFAGDNFESIIFEKTTGWVVIDDYDETDTVEISVDDTSLNVVYFTNTYFGNNWINTR